MLRPLSTSVVCGLLLLLLGPWVWIAEALQTGGQDRNCSDFKTWQEAQAFFTSAGPNDPHRLDTNHNGIACESLPGSPTNAQSPTATRSPVPTLTPMGAADVPTPSAPSTPTPRPTRTATPTRTSRSMAADPRTPTVGTAESPPASVPEVEPTPAPATPSPVPAQTATEPPDAPPEPTVWLLVMEPTELSFDDGSPAGGLRVGERAQVVEVGTAAILIALPEGGTAWVALDPRVQLIAQ